MGHLDVAAGVAGLMKTALQLQHAKIVPTLHFEAPNPKIDFPKTPCALAAAKFSAGISDGKESIAFDTARIQNERLTVLIKHRFHWVAPEGNY